MIAIRILVIIVVAIAVIIFVNQSNDQDMRFRVVCPLFRRLPIAGGVLLRYLRSS